MFDRCLRFRIFSLTLASGGQRSIQLSYGRFESGEVADFECAILRAKRVAVQPLSTSRGISFWAVAARV